MAAEKRIEAARHGIGAGSIAGAAGKEQINDYRTEIAQLS
jgi:hypothetical protein